MKQFRNTIFSGVLILSIAIAGCAQQPKSANSKEAITEAKELTTTDAQLKFLVRESNAFINSKQFDEAISTAKYILSELDVNSEDAKSVLEQAKAQLKKLAQQKLDEAQKEANKKMADAKSKLGNLGN